MKIAFRTSSRLSAAYGPLMLVNQFLYPLGLLVNQEYWLFADLGMAMESSISSGLGLSDFNCSFFSSSSAVAGTMSMEKPIPPMSAYSIVKHSSFTTSRSSYRWLLRRTASTSGHRRRRHLYEWDVQRFRGRKTLGGISLQRNHAALDM